MTIKEFKKKFSVESENVDIRMSEKLKQTPIQPAASTLGAKSEKRFSFRKAFMPLTALACCIIVVLSLVIINPFSSAEGGFTAYAIEINPSISIIADKNDNVLNVFSLNEDADAILCDGAFDDVVGESLETTVEKIIKVVSESGIFNDYHDNIRIYALNDDKKIMDDKLDKFDGILKNKLQKFGHGDIGREKFEMSPNDFKDKMDLQGDFGRLEDMKQDILRRDRYKGNPPPANGNELPPKPNGDPPPANGDLPPANGDLPPSGDPPPANGN